MIYKEIDSPSPLSDKPRVRIVRHAQVCEKISVSPAKLFDMINKGEIDKPFKIVPGGRACGWLEHEIDDWILKRAHNLADASQLSTNRKSGKPNKIALTEGRGG
jgi:predicted DNA-binding transcriptional regulator AlpA